MGDLRFTFKAWVGDKNVKVELSQISGMGNPWAFSITYIIEQNKGHVFRRGPNDWVGPTGFLQEDIQAIGDRIEEFVAGQTDKEIQRQFAEGGNPFRNLKV